MSAMKRALHVALLALLCCDLTAAYSVHEKSAPHRAFNVNRSKTRSAIVSATVAATLLAGQPSGAYFDPSNQIIMPPSSNNELVISNTQTLKNAQPSSFSSFSSLQLANSLASPMGEFKPESDTGISPGFSTFGQWFFLLYVVVSLAAGAKEIGGRILNQMKKDE